jgi:hypothetical protein
MDGAGVHRGHRLRGDARPELAVAPVARLEHHLLALARLDDGRDVRMPSIVAGPRLIDQPLAPVDLDALHDPISRPLITR